MWTLILSVIGVYILLSVVFYFGQDYFFFRPEKLPFTFTYDYPFPFEEVHFDMADGGYINGIHFKVPNSKGVIYYLKGNSKSIKGWGKFAKDFVGSGYDFFMIDYRGFGKSKGKRRNEKTVFQDAQFVYNWLLSKYTEKDIVLYGRSLGSGIAARIASWNQPKMLILDSPYVSFFKQIDRYGFILPVSMLIRYPIRTDKFFKEISCRIFIIHGTRDRLIPFKDGQRLTNLRPDITQLIPIEGAGHNNLPKFPKYHEQLYRILNDEV